MRVYSTNASVDITNRGFALNKNDVLGKKVCFSFERKLNPSNAFFSAGNWNDRDNDQHWPLISWRKEAFSGCGDGRVISDDTVLPMSADTLRLHFTLKVLGNIGIATACNNQEYSVKLQDAIKCYEQKNGFIHLASQYAYNLACARFCWKNRTGAEEIEVSIKQRFSGETVQQWRFDSLTFPLNKIETSCMTNKALISLSHAIEQGLCAKQSVFFHITAYIRLGEGQAVYPSTLLSVNNLGVQTSNFYTVDEVMGIHSQKLGSAIGAIDDWYYDGTDTIAVNPLNAERRCSKMLRDSQQTCDFYDLLDNWVLFDTPPLLIDQHLIIAHLIRGGMFGGDLK